MGARPRILPLLSLFFSGKKETVCAPRCSMYIVHCIRRRTTRCTVTHSIIIFMHTHVCTVLIVHIQIWNERGSEILTIARLVNASEWDFEMWRNTAKKTASCSNQVKMVLPSPLYRSLSLTHSRSQYQLTNSMNTHHTHITTAIIVYRTMRTDLPTKRQSIYASAKITHKLLKKQLIFGTISNVRKNLKATQEMKTKKQNKTN